MWILWLVPSIVLIAFIEYAGHRWLLHRKTVSVGREHIEHHKNYTKEFTGLVEEQLWYDSIPMRMVLALVWSGIAALPVCVWGSTAAGLVFMFVAVSHGGIWHWIHGQMHTPRCRWFIATAYYKRITAFHAVHHKYPRTNYAFLFAPVYDRIFGTYRRPTSLESPE